MKISKDKVGVFNYTLKSEDGEVIDSSSELGPLAYLHGHGQIISGLEKCLEGKEVGDKVDVVIKPEDAYGARSEELIQEVPKSEFEDATALEVGTEFELETENGPLILVITGIKGDMVTVDGNHPLAGETLHFDLEMMEVREATSEELAHGHVHGPGGHEH